MNEPVKGSVWYKRWYSRWRRLYRYVDHKGGQILRKDQRRFLREKEKAKQHKES